MSVTRVLPTNVPIRREKPMAAYYATMVLDLFTGYTRALFLKIFHVQAPPFRPDLGYVKKWWDSDATGPDNDPYVYQYVDRSAVPPVLRELEITQPQAREVNIPGKYQYPDYVVTPTRAYVAGPSGNAINLVQADRLSYLDDAEELERRLHEDVSGIRPSITQATLDGVFFKVVYELDDPNNPQVSFRENRRLWEIELEHGGFLNVGRIMKKMATDGVGSPGHFELRGDNPVWVSDVTLENPTSTLAVLPIPARDLDDDETLVNLGIGGMPSVKRDLGGSGGGGGGDIPVLSAAIERMSVILEAIAKFLKLDV